jgi:hypothetical protein
MRSSLERSTTRPGKVMPCSSTSVAPTRTLMIEVVQAVDVRERQHAQDAVVAAAAEVLDDRARDEVHVAVQEHRALRDAGRARRVDDRREVGRERRDGGGGPRGARVLVDGARRARRRARRAALAGSQTATRAAVREQVGELLVLGRRVDRARRPRPARIAP